MTDKEVQIVIDNFLIPGDQLSETCGKVFTSLLSADIGLSGGIPEGINVLISGAPKIGKTSFCLYFASQCQKVDPDKQVFFFDCEGRLRTELLKSIADLDLSRFNIIKSNKKKILSAEDYLNLIIHTLKDYPRCICILDSIASLAPEAELNSLIGDSVRMASTASLMYKVFRQTSQILSVTKSTFIGLTHLVSNPNPGMGKKTFAVGGNAIKYQASVHLEGAWKKNIEYNNKCVGQIAHFKVISSALGPPGYDINVPIVFGRGVDKATDVFNVAIELGMITKAGSWYQMPDENIIENIKWPDGKSPKIQGQEKVIQYLYDHMDITDHIEQFIRLMMISS